MIYLHEARGADRAITDAIDSHVQAERHDDDDGQALAPVGLIARKINYRPGTIKAPARDLGLRRWSG